MVEGSKIVTIVVTFNATRWIEECFNSLINATINNHTIIAIDNASSDETVKLIKKKYPQVLLIESKKNLGFGKANNIGLSRALKENADFVFLLNQDAWIKQNTLSQLIQISHNNPEYGIISPVHLNKNNKIDSEFVKYCYLDLNTEFTYDSLCANSFKEIYSTSFINAAAWLMTKECLLKNGGFMPIFPHYGEDGNYCERVINSGLKIGFTPGITIIHDREVKKRKLSFRKKFNRLYIYLLSIFTSANARGWEYMKYCAFKTINSFKIFYKDPLILLTLPIALLKIIFNAKQIKSQRKQSSNLYKNFLS